MTTRPTLPASVELEHLRRELARAQAELPALETTLRERRAALRDEEADVERAAGEGLVAFLERLVGSRRVLLARERAEAASARLKHDLARSALDAARARLVELRGGIERLEEVRARVAGRLDDSTPACALRALQLELRELEEALAAAGRALRALDWLDESLRSAERWGVFDLFGGGLIATFVKHSRLDEAHTRLAALQAALRRLERELSDVDARAPESLRIDGFTRFADFFLDGLFVDWMVQREITGSIGRVSALRARLVRLRGELEQRERRGREELYLLAPGQS